MIIPAAESNHGGDMNIAREMIKVAKDCGCEVIKFQLYDAEDDKGKPHYEWVKKAELSFDQAKMLFDYGKEVGIEVFFSVFGVKYVDWCETIGVKRYKIACDIRDIKLMRRISHTEKPLIISTIGCECLEYHGKNQVSWLSCIPEYPAIAIGFSRVKWWVFGFSDHTIGLDAAKIALARGAKIIEKHFILDREHSLSPEKDWSMNPEELKELKRWESVCHQVLK